MTERRPNRYNPEISEATFDILESLSKVYTGLQGHFARGTGGVDVDALALAFLEAHNKSAAKAA